MKSFIVVGSRGGSISLKPWKDILDKLGFSKTQVPRYVMERCRYLHVTLNKSGKIENVTFGEFDPNCKNRMTVKEFDSFVTENPWTIK